MSLIGGHCQANDILSIHLSSKLKDQFPRQVIPKVSQKLTDSQVL
jgi:hypothetical protein